jgi:hypothetical protein
MASATLVGTAQARPTIQSVDVAKSAAAPADTG